MSKKLVALFCLSVLSISIFSDSEVALADSIQNRVCKVQPRADIIGWRYKTENGKVYKRKYNYTKEKWIGSWIYVGKG